METQKTTSAISDLIIINNDRYEGYKKAAEETKDADLKSLFNNFSTQSRGFANSLRKFIADSDEQPEKNETKNTGKLFRVWMDIKAAITAHDRKAILASCEFGEDHAKAAYEEVLNHSEDLSAMTLDVVKHQYEEIKKGHDHVKSLRNSTK